MTKAGVLVATVLALLLGIVALVTDPGKRASVAKGSGPLLGMLDIGSIDLLTVRSAGKESQLRRLQELPDMWVSSSSGGATWPVNARSVFATLRLLSGLTIDPAQNAPEGEFTTLLLSSHGGNALEVRIGAHAVTGRTRVWLADGRTAVAPDDGLSQAFKDADLTGWRVLELFPLDAAGASRVTLEESGKPLRLARVAKSWALTAPIAAKADEPIVTTVLAKLAQSAVLKTDSGVRPEGIENPAARILIEIDRQGTGVESGGRKTIVQELIVGSNSGIAGDAVLCSLRAWVEADGGKRQNELWGPLFATVERGVLAGISTVPEAYLSRVVVDAPAADVGSVRIERLTGEKLAVVRDGDSWRAAGEGGARVDAAGATAIRSLVKLLTEERAKSVTTKELQFEPDATVVLGRADGAMTARCEVGRFRTDQVSQTLIGVRSGGVMWVFDRSADQLAKLLGT